MKKSLLSLCIILIFFFTVSAYTPTEDLQDKLNIITGKIDILIDERGENYRDIFLDLLKKYDGKYSENSQLSYVLNYLKNHLNQASNRPNILLIIADDMWLDASPWYSDYLGKKPYTPTLDKLAKSGLVFDNLWSNPLCSPTRSTILTWKYWFNTWVLWALSKQDDGVSIEEYSLQTLITKKSIAWYQQAVIWKWHLATNNNWNNNNPWIMWIPYYSWYISWAMKDYSNWKKTTNWETTISTVYATTEFTDDSIKWIDSVKNKPWFLWLAYTAPHTPFHMPPNNLLSENTKNNLSGTEEDIQENPLPYYLAAIEAMDSEIWRLLDNLSDSERNNTIIIFIGDNGTPTQVTQTPFQRWESKWSVSRGWVHVPMIVAGAWISPGRKSEFINTTDIYTTIAELTGLILPTYWNSISFAPLLFNKQREVNRDYLYAEISSPNKRWWVSAKNGWSIRKNGYQYISLDNGTEKLFADSDLGQENNLFNSLTSIASELRELWISLRWGDFNWEYGQYPIDTDDIVCIDE